MTEAIIQMFSYDFMVRAILVGSFVALSASLLGVILVLKRYSMIGDGLSHVGFGALSIALALNLSPLYIAIPACIVAAFFLLKISENSNIKGDSAIAIIASSALSLGVIATSLSSGMNVDIYSYMFGSILAMRDGDIYISIALCAVCLLAFIFFRNKIFAATFDPDFAKATGVGVEKINIMIALLTALTVVVGMRIMGTMLISSLIIFPALSSMRLFRSFKAVIVSSVAISLLCFFSGTLLSYFFSFPTGASVVVVNLAVFLICSLLRIVRYSR